MMHDASMHLDTLLQKQSLYPYPCKPNRFPHARASLIQSSKREPLFSSGAAVERRCKRGEDSSFFEDDGPYQDRREDEEGGRSSRWRETDRVRRPYQGRKEEKEDERPLHKDFQRPGSSLPPGARTSGATALKRPKGKKEKKEPSDVVRDAEGFVIKIKSSRDPQHKDTAFSTPRTFPDGQILKFERLGWIYAKDMISRKQFDILREEIKQHIEENMLEALKHRVRVLRPDIRDPASTITSIEEARTALKGKDIGFLQFFNLHRTNEGMLRTLVLGRRFGGMASQLLDTPNVKVYQDSVFYKLPGYSETNWHSDLRMAPFDGNKMVTLWLPMRPICQSEQDSGLKFANGSHKDFSLPFWHNIMKTDLEGRGYEVESPATFEQCDGTWHHGWTLHCAGPQPQDSQPRAALAVTFIAGDMKVMNRKDPSIRKEMLHDEDKESFEEWLRDVKPGAVAEHRLLPVTFGCNAIKLS
ncbi:hypothetical protein CEUSTIGMA_g6289.t1 [Chlamydomonas eustigma]|uniref:Uncharacterized protein n=1 Tax=Chlamydomonas eustigma TaxID=1157962 RepID=A0A250X6Z2_9CHLO|nr:hypothetical protein CEUSTIGMA_g6289.t1 [Chlamydomonas eustigma]|eukprot:GAX78851.1 hypothetical protein CEUSTIGMA_g6289.t1 [Chlamydomonas eustigma]